MLNPSTHGTESGTTHFVFLTGISGAGKSHALKVFEDIGYFCVDNLPLALLPQFAELCARATPRRTRVALVIDVRETALLTQCEQLIADLKADGQQVETVFFDADDKVLLRRFSETRRPHPLSPGGSVAEGLAQERKILAPLHDHADRRVDTSNFSVHQLKAYVQRHFGADPADNPLAISVLAFGFKHGLPLESDLVFDVRFLNNPHFVPSLKPKTGEAPEVRDYVLADPRAEKLLRRLYDLLCMTIPEYRAEGRRYLTIGVGCTGGKHRSVVIARELAARLTIAGHSVTVALRDAHSETEHAEGSGHH